MRIFDHVRLEVTRTQKQWKIWLWISCHYFWGIQPLHKNKNQTVFAKSVRSGHLKKKSNHVAYHGDKKCWIITFWDTFCSLSIASKRLSTRYFVYFVWVCQHVICLEIMCLQHLLNPMLQYVAALRELLICIWCIEVYLPVDNFMTDTFQNTDEWTFK